MPKEMWRSIAAFANSHGGVVLLGVDETSGFSVTGVDDPASLETRISELCSSEIEPPVRAEIRSHQINGAWVVTVEVPELDPLLQPAYYKSKGLPAGATIRVGDGSRQLTSYEVHLLLSRRGQPEDELRPITEATRADLDPDALDNYIRHMRSSRPRTLGDRDDAAVLRMTKILVPHDDDLVPSVAGLLAFGHKRRAVVQGVSRTDVSEYPIPALSQSTLLRILEDVPLAEGGMVAENRGSSLAVIAESLRRQGNPPPQFTDSIAAFEITFRTTSIETNSTASQQDDHDITRHDAAAQQIMDELGGGPLSRRELAERTGLAPHAIRYRLNQLRQAGQVRLVGTRATPAASSRSHPHVPDSA